MKPRSEPATKAERARYAILSTLPCAACRKLGRYGTGAIELHHLTDGGRRISNFHVIPLCRWHHRKVIPPGFGLKNTTEAIAMFGPSLETSKRDFTARFGSEMDLLKETNALLGIRAVIDGEPCPVCD